MLTSETTVVRDQDLCVTVHVICNRFALEGKTLTPECALRLIDLQGTTRIRIRAPQAALDGSRIPAQSMRLQSLVQHSTELLEEHNAAHPPAAAQRQHWRACAPPPRTSVDAACSLPRPSAHTCGATATCTTAPALVAARGPSRSDPRTARTSPLSGPSSLGTTIAWKRSTSSTRRASPSPHGWTP